MSAPPEPVTARPYRDDRDFWLIHALAIETYPIAPVYWNWDIRRWEGQRFYGENPAPDPRWANWIRLWQAVGGRLVGVAHPEGRLGEAFLQLHSDYRFFRRRRWSPGARSTWLQKARAVGACASTSTTTTPPGADCSPRGVGNRKSNEDARRLRLGAFPLPVPVPPAGYRLRETADDPADDEALADLLTVCFHHAHTGAEFRGFATHAPSFRRDLDLVMEGAGGVLACYVGVTWEPACRRGIFEPVCTRPDHRGRGLALAAIREGLRRLRALGAEYAFVETGDREPANALYDAVGFGEAHLGHYWSKAL